MRRHTTTLAILACCVAAAARADVDLGPILVSGYLEAGGRAIADEDDSGKFEEYRDPHEGLFGAGDVTFENPTRRNYFRLGGFDLGEDDADYFVEGGRWGRWGLSGSYSQLPHNFSNQALSPYFGIAGGDLR